MSNRELPCKDRVGPMWKRTKSDLERFMKADDDKSRDEFRSYAAGFWYRAPETFEGQPEGCWIYQMSGGGPSDDIRFYGDPHGSLYRAEYWFMDWGDGAKVIVTKEKCIRWLWDDLCDMGAVRSEYDQAMEE